MEVDIPRVLYTYAAGLTAQDRWEEASAYLQQAIQQKADFTAAICLLATAEFALGKEEEALAHFHRVLELEPDHPEAWFFLGKNEHLKGDLDRAAVYYRKGADRDPVRAGLQYHALEALLSTGDLTLCQEMRWLFVDRRFRRLTISAPSWDGASLNGGTLLIFSEAGFGDLIQNCRWLPAAKELAGGRVILECPPELAGLLRKSEVADLVTVPDRSNSFPGRSLPEPFDAQISSMDLPLAVARRGVPFPRQIPYLHPAPDAVARWKKRLSAEVAEGDLKVGLRWAGSPRYPDDARRSAHLSDFAPLAGVKGVHYFSVQKGARQEEAAVPPPGLRITDLSAELTDFEETAAALANLDLLISTDTATPHLAGALGTPVWLALDDYPNNRWRLEGDSTLWYPTMRLFRQTRRGDWRPVVTQITELLQEAVTRPARLRSEYPVRKR